MSLVKLHPLRLTQKDYTKLIKDANTTGLTRSGYLRKLINQQEIKPSDSYNKLAWEISKIGTNINQLSHKTKAAGHASREDVETAVFLLKKIIKMMRAMR